MVSICFDGNSVGLLNDCTIQCALSDGSRVAAPIHMGYNSLLRIQDSITFDFTGIAPDKYPSFAGVLNCGWSGQVHFINPTIRLVNAPSIDTAKKVYLLHAFDGGFIRCKGSSANVPLNIDGAYNGIQCAWVDGGGRISGYDGKTHDSGANGSAGFTYDQIFGHAAAASVLSIDAHQEEAAIPEWENGSLAAHFAALDAEYRRVGILK